MGIAPYDEPQPEQQTVAGWFDETYRSRGFGYLRPAEAYPIFLQLLGARAGETLLDVGCGPGLLLEAARSRGLNATGVDISAAAVEIARGFARGAEVEQGNAESLGHPDGSFHHVACIGALERMLDRERVLAEMRRVARDDARFCIMVRNSATLGWMVWNRFLGRRNVRGHQDALSLEEWSGLFQRSGFAVRAVYADQWRRQKLRRVLRGFRRHDPRRPEPVAKPLLPLRFANEFIFVLEKASCAASVTRTASGRSDAGKMYESLARYQWLVRRFRRRRPGSGLEMHKSLSPPAAVESGPGAGLAPLHDWLHDWLQPPPAGRVLDVGCGFGATMFRWAERRPGRQVGISSSPFQVEKASAEARRLGLDDRCEFRLQSYDDPVPGRFCAAIAVESLFHSGDLLRTLSNLASCLEPGARFLLLEDMAADAGATRHEDALELLRRWSAQRMYGPEDFRQALEDAGFELRAQRDLTAQVHHRPLARLSVVERRLKRLRKLMPLPPVRRLCDAFLGGVALERSYARGRARYVAMLAERKG